jgi:hypothetical protein
MGWQGPAVTARTMFFCGSPILAQASDRGKICFSLTVQAGHLTGGFSSSTGLLLMWSHERRLAHLARYHRIAGVLWHAWSNTMNVQRRRFVINRTRRLASFRSMRKCHGR